MSDKFKNRRGGFDDAALDRALASWHVEPAPAHILDNVMNEIGLRPQVMAAQVKKQNRKQFTVFPQFSLARPRYAIGGALAAAVMLFMLLASGVQDIPDVSTSEKSHVKIAAVKSAAEKVATLIDEDQVETFVAEVSTPLEEETVKLEVFDNLFEVASAQFGPGKQQPFGRNEHGKKCNTKTDRSTHPGW